MLYHCPIKKTQTQQTRTTMPQERTHTTKKCIKIATAEPKKNIRLSTTIGESMYKNIRAEMSELTLSENETIRFIIASYFAAKTERNIFSV